MCNGTYITNADKFSHVVVTEPVCVEELDASWRSLVVQLVNCKNEETEDEC